MAVKIPLSQLPKEDRELLAIVPCGESMDAHTLQELNKCSGYFSVTHNEELDALIYVVKKISKPIILAR